MEHKCKICNYTYNLPETLFTDRPKFSYLALRDGIAALLMSALKHVMTGEAITMPSFVTQYPSEEQQVYAYLFNSNLFTLVLRDFSALNKIKMAAYSDYTQANIDFRFTPNMNLEVTVTIKK